MFLYIFAWKSIKNGIELTETCQDLRFYNIYNYIVQTTMAVASAESADTILYYFVPADGGHGPGCLISQLEP